MSSSISTSSTPLTPFSTGSEPFACGWSPPMGLELLAPLPAAPFLAGADLALFAADRVVGAALSLLDVELCELERAFSPFVEDEVSDLLFDRRERLSTGIFAAGRAKLGTTDRQHRFEEGGLTNQARTSKQARCRGREYDGGRGGDGERKGAKKGLDEG